MSGAARDAAAFHVVFVAACGAVLLAPEPALGWRLLALVVGYNVALPLVGLRRGHPDWVKLWAFLVPLSLFQVVPDAALASVVGSLDFPDTGGPRLGPVPLAMAGMWTIPLWGALFIAERQRGRVGRRAVWAAGLTGIALVGAEATLWAVPIWQAVGVQTVAHVALYVIAPEILLGAVAYLAWVWTRDRGRWEQVGAAALVSLVYLGALVASFGLVEQAHG